MHDGRLRTSIVDGKLHEAHQPLLKKCTNEEAQVRERSTHLAHGFDVFAVVGKQSALTYGALVVDLPDPANQGIVERDLASDQTSLLRAPDHVARLGVDLPGPPALKR